MAYVIYVAYVLYIRDIRNIRNIKNIYCWGGPSGRGKRQENRRDRGPPGGERDKRTGASGAIWAGGKDRRTVGTGGISDQRTIGL